VSAKQSRIPLAALACCVSFASLTVTVPSLEAQGVQTTMLDYATGSEFEDYLRALQVAGLTQLYPWSIRAFSPREIKKLASADTAGPWRLATALNLRRAAVGPVTAGAIFNSAYPYGINDGPVWAGRGLTGSVSAGAAGIIGPFSITLAPLAFWAQNTAFPLLKGNLPAPDRYQNTIGTGSADFPERFGDKPYSRIDLGNSSVRFDSKAITAGVSSANEWIGPATEYPFLLGTNAPGFPHIFAGTGEPWNLWIARVHARVAWGKLYQSAYSPVTGTTRYTSATMPGTERLATYLTFVLLPRGIPGLELGASRFLHVPYRAGEPSADFWRKPFKVFFLRNEYAGGDSAGADNQLASAFFRWVFPKSGFEVYGERGYEDQFYDIRDLIQRPDHEREYMLGAQKVLNRRDSFFDVIKAELINFQYPSASVYRHVTLRQGHTNRGQLLAAGVGAGTGAASTLSWTRYTSAGRTTATFRRIVRADEGEYLLTGITNPRSSDVIIAAGLERMRIGKRADFGVKAEAMDDLNRNFSSDVPNLNLQFTARLKHW
jgi:hypothetical protein